MSGTSKKIQETLQQIRNLEKVASHLTDLNQRINKMNADREVYRKTMLEKDELVKDLDGLSLKGIFHKVLGNKEEQIEKGRQEFLEVYMKLEEVNKAIDSLEFERKILEEKRLKQSGLHEELEELLKKREKELISTNSQTGLRLQKLASMEDQHQLLIWEIGEAEVAGAKAQKVLDEIIHFLKGARNWGGMYGNSRMSQYHRRSNIDKARARMHLARQQLYVFQRELGDLYAQTPDYASGLQMDLYEGFLATIFRNMISDWVLQNKIKNTLANVNSVRDAVVLELQRLVAARRAEKEGLENTAFERRNILMQQ